MSFSKRIITKDRIKSTFQDKGYTALVNLITKNDVIFVKDEISQKIIDLIYKADNQLVIEEIIEKIK